MVLLENLMLLRDGGMEGCNAELVLWLRVHLEALEREREREWSAGCWIAGFNE